MHSAPHDDPKLWKILSTKLLLQSKHLTVVEDTVRLPDGNRSSYTRFDKETSHSVIMIARDGQGQLLLQREYSHPPAIVMWQLPGGSMNPGETIEQAAKRELAEESGVGTNKTTILGSFYTRNRLSDQLQHVVLCEDLFENKIPGDFDEFITSHWITEAKIHAMIKQKQFNNINLLAALNILFHS